jgi:Rrf2 family cysteine metabolism transcriptional repressor
MRISAKGEYAIRALLDLTLHQADEGGTLVTIQDVARRQGIPARYLEHVLLQLKRAGFLQSKRGATGGYRLAREPHAVSVGEVLRVVEGRGAGLEVGGSRDRGRDADLADLWRSVSEAVAGVLDRTTFRDLAEQAAARRSPHRAVYHI